MTPATLNQTADLDLLERAAAVLAMADDAGTARRPADVPFVTNALALERACKDRQARGMG